MVKQRENERIEYTYKLRTETGRGHANYESLLVEFRSPDSFAEQLLEKMSLAVLRTEDAFEALLARDDQMDEQNCASAKQEVLIAYRELTQLLLRLDD